MAFNVPEDVKAVPSFFSLGNVPIKNVRKFKYLGHMVTNLDEDPSHFLSFRIASAFQKWNELKTYRQKDFYVNARKNSGSLCSKPTSIYLAILGIACQ